MLISKCDVFLLLTIPCFGILCRRNAFMNAKVAQMEPHEVMVSQIYQNLFADHVYSNKPKGEASEVVTLTYQEVIAYYNAYYHPSNGQAFCYGQQEYISSCLDALEPVLDEYEASAEIRKHSEVDWQDMTKIDQEKKQIGYPSYAEDVDFRAVVAWVLNDEPMDLRTEVAWHLINQLLVGSSTSPIPKAIVDADLGDDVIGYFENGLQQWVMALGVSGIETNDKVDIAREAIIGKLTSIVSNGFPSETLAAALNKMEFKVRRVRVRTIDGMLEFESLNSITAPFLFLLFQISSEIKVPQTCLLEPKSSTTCLFIGTMIVIRSRHSITPRRS